MVQRGERLGDRPAGGLHPERLAVLVQRHHLPVVGGGHVHPFVDGRQRRLHRRHRRQPQHEPQLVRSRRAGCTGCRPRPSARCAGRPAQLAAFTQTEMLMPSVGPMVSWLGTTMNVRRIGVNSSAVPIFPGFQSGPRMLTVPPWLPMPELSQPTLPRPSSSFQWPTRPRASSGGPGGASGRRQIHGHIGGEQHVELGGPVAARHARAAAGAAAAAGPAAAAGRRRCPRAAAASVHGVRPAAARRRPIRPAPPHRRRRPARCRPAALPPAARPRPSAEPSPVDPGVGAVGGRPRTAPEQRPAPPGSPARRCCAAGWNFSAEGPSRSAREPRGSSRR